MRTPVLSVLLLVACTGASNGPNGDPEGERIEVSADCEAYLACAAEVDPDNLALYESNYGVDGACWRSASEALACTKACQAQLEAETAVDPRVPACWPEGQPDMRLVFPRVETWAWEPDRACKDVIAWAKTSFDARGTLEIQVDYLSDIGGTGFPCAVDGLSWSGSFDRDGWVESLAGEFAPSFRRGTMTYRQRADDQEFECGFTGTPEE